MAAILILIVVFKYRYDIPYIKDAAETIDEKIKEYDEGPNNDYDIMKGREDD